MIILRRLNYNGKADKKRLIYIALAVLIAILALVSIFLMNGADTSKKVIKAKDAVESAFLKHQYMRAELAATGYDYDTAIALLDGLDSEEITALKDKITAEKETLVKADVYQIPHIFFHSLIADTSKAFDGDTREAGYNQVMTTIDEFNKIMQQMYDRGYVLVSLHDVSVKTKAPDGTEKFVAGEIMLPPGKKPFVLSVDDVCYYEYMEGDGFATRIVIDKNGKPTCEMKLDDGSVVTGDFDVVPLLERFIEKHPDFSYRGARGILAFTGYSGILGYRTCPSYSDNPTYEKDIADAKAVSVALKSGGWELASHSWGHRNMKTMNIDNFKTDTDRWEKEVESIIGPTDIIIFPFGADIGSWVPYSASNERFNYLKGVGFDYFCNVDSSKAWLQIGTNYVRQGRRNLDGYRMYYDMINPNVDKLSDLFDVDSVFDKARPVPVPPM